MKTSQEVENLKGLYEKSKDQALADFLTFLKLESVSSEATHTPQTQACCQWVINYLKKIGFNVELWPTTGHPTIFASYDKAGPNQPILLIYNHYDVQPADPLDLWESPPFTPTIRNGQIYARGAQDNKGQCFYVLLALKSLIERDGTLPINVKLCIEGEEECGSTGLSGILQDRKKELKADYLAIVDLGMQDAKTPAVTLGIRGILSMDVIVEGTKRDLHSGSHGGLAYNPNKALVQVLNKMYDKEGKVAIPGFYDDVIAVSDKDKANLTLSFDPEKYEAEYGAKPTGGEKAFSYVERNWFRPTIEINGIAGGYAGEGFKTVIPAKAIAKVSCRLVPNQDPIKIGRLVANFLESHAPEGTRISVHLHPGYGKALRCDASSKVAKAFAKAYEEIFHTTCHTICSGASIPIATELAEACGGDLVMVGLGLGSDCIHAPNEHFGIDRIEKGFLSICRTLQILKS